jgi:hypothetical protein
MSDLNYMCPCCGFPGLREPPRSAGGGGSYEICPSCGFQFGVSDDDAGFTYESWRTRWESRGMPWSSSGIERPRGWNAQEQRSRVVQRRPEKRSRKKLL